MAGIADYLREKVMGTNTGRAISARQRMLDDPEAGIVRTSAPMPAPGAIRQPSSADPETQRLLDKYKNLKRGAVIPGRDTKGKDDVPVNVTRGEAILPVKTVDAMGGSEAVRDLIHKTNGKPPVGGIRRGGKYADGVADEEVPIGGKIVSLGSVFRPGGAARPISDVTFLDLKNPPRDISRILRPTEIEAAKAANADVMAGRQGTFGGGSIKPNLAASAVRPVPSSLVDQIPNEFAPTAATPVSAAPTPTPAAPAAATPAPAAATPTPAATQAPISDNRLASLGVKADWTPMTEAAGQPVQNATIYSSGRQAAGYGTQTPEMEAATKAKAEANRSELAGIYERESQARLGARIASARLRGEDAYADSLERDLARKTQTDLAKSKAATEAGASAGLGQLRAAQTTQIGQELKQTAAKQQMTDEYLNAATTPERRKVLAATLGIKPDSGWQISTSFGPPDAMGQPTKSTIAHRTTASGELETRDLSGGTAQKAQVTPKAEYDKLPAGSQYVGPDGLIYIKKG